MHMLGRVSTLSIKCLRANNGEADLKKDIKPLFCHDCVHYTRGCQVPIASPGHPGSRCQVSVSDPGEGKYWRLQHCSTADQDQDTGLCNTAVLLHTTHHPASTSAFSTQLNVLQPA